MDLGLCKFEPGDGALAARIGATWAHQYAWLDDGTPDLRDLLGEMVDAGCRPVFDCRTSVQKLAALLFGADGNPLENREASYRWYAEAVLAFLDLHPRVLDVEVWASPECPHLAPGQCLTLDYGGLLTAVYAQVKAARPDVTVWTGGFGTMGATGFLDDGLCLFAPRAFDVCNTHPFVTPVAECEEDCATLRLRFGKARELLDTRCAGQPLRSTAFGVPTTPGGRPLLSLGDFYRTPADRVRLLPEEEALPWWLGSLRELALAGFEVVCVLGHDWRDAADRSQNHSGLLRRNGQDKCFLGELCEALPEITKTAP